MKGTVYYSALGLFLLSITAIYVPGIHINNTIINNSSSAHTFNLPAGMPTPTNLTKMGDTLVPFIMQTARFKKLSNGAQYHVNPYSSFGYTWGPGIKSTESITLFSPDNSSYIVTDIYVSNNTGTSNAAIYSGSLVSNKTIKDMYFVNATKINVSASIVHSDNWGGYQEQYCSGSFFGVCTGTSSIGKVYGNIQIPSTIAAPSGATSSCCLLGEWTGVASSANGTLNLTQGGIFVKFDNLGYWNWSTPWAFFTEYFPTQTHAIIYQPPSWFTGSGQTVNMTTEPLANCPNGTNNWYEIWSSGGSSTSKGIGCRSTSSITWAESELESPGGCSGRNGNYNGFCQLPQFSNVGFTGNICPAISGTCRNINSNYDPIIGQYIQHNSQDTSTSSISSGGNSWTESWLSSN